MLSSNFVDEVILYHPQVKFCIVTDLWLVSNFMLNVLSSLWFDDTSMCYVCFFWVHFFVVFVLKWVFVDAKTCYDILASYENIWFTNYFG